jgi:hypothetical protein
LRPETPNLTIRLVLHDRVFTATTMRMLSDTALTRLAAQPGPKSTPISGAEQLDDTHFYILEPDNAVRVIQGATAWRPDRLAQLVTRIAVDAVEGSMEVVGPRVGGGDDGRRPGSQWGGKRRGSW